MTESGNPKKRRLNDLSFTDGFKAIIFQYSSKASLFLSYSLIKSNKALFY